MNATIPDLNQPCPNCDHPLKFHDPEDGSCDVFSGDYKIGACPCGRRSQPVARHIPDDQVAWYAGTSRTAKWTAEMSTRVDIIALAREVQERRAADTRTPSFTDDEMEAIRKAFAQVVTEYEWCGPGETHGPTVLGDLDLPESVIAWVLGDPSPAPCKTCGNKGWIAEDHSWGQPYGEQHQCPSCGGTK